MKVLMLTWEYPPRVVGGISRVVYDLSRTLLKDGHDVTVVTYKEGDVPDFEDDKGVQAVQNQLNESYQSGVVEDQSENYKGIHHRSTYRKFHRHGRKTYQNREYLCLFFQRFFQAPSFQSPMHPDSRL